MKKLIAGLLAALLLFTVSLAEDLDFRSMTGLDELQKKLDAGITIGKVYYTDGYGFSTSEFSTDDPEEIRQLWTTLNKIQVAGLVNESITDWYPQIVFYLSDGSHAHVSFESHWLSIGRYNYEVVNDEDFWMLTAELVQKHEQLEQGTVPGGKNRTVVTAVAAEINPEELKSVAVDAKIVSCDGAACTITLLVPERYRADEIFHLKVGDAIFTQGREVDIHSVAEKDGYIVLNDEIYLYESIDMYYWIMEEDDHTWTELATVSVPVSGSLLFLDDIDPATGETLMNPTVHNKKDFLTMMRSKDDPGFDIRNVMVAFDDHGELALIRRYYVPWQ